MGCFGLLRMNNISVSDEHAATVSNHTLSSKEIYNFSTTFCRYFKGQTALDCQSTILSLIRRACRESSEY